MINDLKPAVVDQRADISQAGEAPTKANTHSKARKATKGKLNSTALLPKETDGRLISLPYLAEKD